MNIALIAHDQKKEEMVQLAVAYEGILQKHHLFTRLQVTRFLSGPLGGDQQIGAMIAKNEMDVIVFLRDPLTSQPHEPDILALLRLCDVHRIPVATNLATAEILLKAVEQGNMAWREI